MEFHANIGNLLEKSKSWEKVRNRQCPEVSLILSFMVMAESDWLYFREREQEQKQSGKGVRC